MSPTEIKSRASAFDIFVNVLSKKTLIHHTAVSFSKEAHTRSGSPLRPWENEMLIRKQIRSMVKASVCQRRAYRTEMFESKKNDKRHAESEPTAQKSSAFGSKNKMIISDFVHHSDTSQYIKEYRKARHQLTEAQRDYGCKQINKAYEILGVPTKNRSSTNSCGDGSRKRSKLSFETSAGEQDTPSHPSKGISNRKVNRHLKLETIPLPQIRTIENKAKREYIAKYRLNSLNRQYLRSAKQRLHRKTLRGMKDLSLASVSQKSNNDFKIPKKKKTLSEKIVDVLDSEDENELKEAEQKTTRRTKLPPIPSQNCLSVQKELNTNTLLPFACDKASQAFPLSESTNLTTTYTNEVANTSTIQHNSIKDLLVSSVKDFHPFNAQQNGSHAPQNHNANNGKISVKRNISDHFEKQSLSEKIYNRLTYNNPKKKLQVRECFTPIKDRKAVKQASCVVAGKSIQKLPSITTQEKNQDRSDLRKGRRFVGPSILRTCELQGPQEKENCASGEHERAPEPRTVDRKNNLKILLNCHSVSKPHIPVKNAAY